MARRKRRRKSYGLGSPPDVHRERATGAAREQRRLVKVLRGALKSNDCDMATDVLVTLAQQSGAYLIDRDGYRGRARFGAPITKLRNKFKMKCVRTQRPAKTTARNVYRRPSYRLGRR